MNLAGTYIWGYDRLFIVDEHRGPLDAFRRHSRERYPLILVHAEGSVESYIAIENEYAPVIFLPISPLRSRRDFERFSIAELWGLLPEFDYYLNFHQDGFLLREGWEDYCLSLDWDYIGAPWPSSLWQQFGQAPPWSSFGPAVSVDSVVGNGGLCFRKGDKMRELLGRIDLDSYRAWWDEGNNVPEDSFFCYFGFGSGLWKPVERELAYLFSQEPIGDGQSYGFHAWPK